jgi:hypothetical protein
MRLNPLKIFITNECLPSFTTFNAKYHFLIYILLCLQFTMSKIINLCCLLSHILFTLLQSSQSIYYRNSYSRKSQKHYFNRSRLLRRGVLSQFFVNRAKYINYDYCDINYKVRYYMPFKGTRRLAGSSKNSTYNLNKPITRKNIPLSFLTEIPKKFRNRFLNTESRETFISFDSDRKSFF